MEYTIIKAGTIEKLAVKVTEKMKDNWFPHGSMVVVVGEFLQPVVKYDFPPAAHFSYDAGPLNIPSTGARA